VTTRHLPARPMRRGDPIFARVDSKVLAPGLRDYIDEVGPA
jgi:hypothetical protein